MLVLEGYRCCHHDSALGYSGTAHELSSLQSGSAHPVNNHPIHQSSLSSSFVADVVIAVVSLHYTR